MCVPFPGELAAPTARSAWAARLVDRGQGATDQRAPGRGQDDPLRRPAGQRPDPDVPSTLASKFITGSATDITIEPAAARWMIDSVR